MKLIYLAALFLTLVSLVIAAPAQNKTEHLIKMSKKDMSVKAKSSHDAPEDVPIPIHKLEEAAAIASQQYCLVQKPGETKAGDAKLLWTSGNGFLYQRTSILESKTLGLVLAFEGTVPISPMAFFEDFYFFWSGPDDRYKKTLSSDSKIHQGFQIAYTNDADKVIKNVKKFMEKKNTDKVTVVGHSLGAAMAVLAAVHLETVMEGSVHQILTFGQPRVGNVAFANDLDKLFKGKFYYTINGADPVARVGPRILDFQHASGQIWINPASSSNWKFYPGQENIHGSISSIPSPLIFTNHCGTYFHTHIDHYLGLWECPAKAGQDAL
ncbi:hypothetical protein MCAP1_003610 [Malassezia caprae]|uniref:Fungal lipase-type domain-containing protein n=1 Tax=Malassezia caprae TaxID=1381934 RepID=A0AAF0EBJ9_9BASI|nr:hypothetical protein MCAP1_003610 [Malassezia caprae]